MVKHPKLGDQQMARILSDKPKGLRWRWAIYFLVALVATMLLTALAR